MNIIRIDKNNQINGEGLRCVVWCSGCGWNCDKCHNPETHDPKFGHPYCAEDEKQIIEQLSKREIYGVTLTGGDPFFPSNRAGMTELCKMIKKNFPNKTIWCYTGFNFEDIARTELIKYIDVLIDGTYVEAKNPGIGKLKWRGSYNQRVINVQKSLICGGIIEWTCLNGKTISENENKKA